MKELLRKIVYVLFFTALIPVRLALLVVWLVVTIMISPIAIVVDIYLWSKGEDYEFSILGFSDMLFDFVMMRW